VAVVIESSVVPPEDRSRTSAPELKRPVFRSEEKVKAGRLAEPAGNRRVVPTARVSVVVAEPMSVVVALRLAILPLVVTISASWAAEKVEPPVKALAEVPLWVYAPSVVMPETPVRAPVEEMSQSEELMTIVSPLSPRVMAPLTVSVSIKVEVEFRVASLASAVPMSVELTRRVLSMVEEPETKMPAVVEVGVSVAAAKVEVQAPFCPAAAQAEPAEVTTLEPLSSRHLEAVRLFRVRSEVRVRVPFSLVVPSTDKVVDGAAVPMPT